MMDNINLLTRQDVIAGVAEQWREQYPAGISHDRDKIYERLVAEKPSTVEAVKAIIDNDSWTILECDVCDERRDAVVMFDNRTTDYGTRICQDCLSAGMRELAE